MTEQLRRALEELASTDDAARWSPSADALWRSGRRDRRVSVASSAAAVALLTTAALLLPGLVLQDRTGPGPASYSRADLAVPDHLWAPSSWAPTAGAGDRTGPLALVAAADRRGPWLVTSSREWFGISAVDQSYVWLDLPDRDREEVTEVALSPDGRYVGYFLTGDPALPTAQSHVVGFAAYDTETGRVHRHEVRTQRGLAAYGLLWAPDSHRLVASYGQYMRMAGASNRGRVVAWSPEDDSIVPVGAESVTELVGSGPGGIMFPADDGERITVLDAASGATRSLRVAAPAQQVVATADMVHVNPSGTAIAMRGEMRLGGGVSTTGLYAGRVRDGVVRDLRLLGRRWQVNRVFGWLDDERLLAEAHRRGGEGHANVAYDVGTRQVEAVIGETGTPESSVQPLFAADLLRQPLVAGRQPPRAWHPWTVPLSVLAVGLLVVSWRRRRRRPR